MNYVFSTHTRPLWKGLVYEGVRLVCIGLTLAAVVGIAVGLVGGKVGV